MKILLTQDYELFLGGRSGTVNRCLIQPMRLMLDQVGKLGVKFTLFVDAAYLYRLRELSCKYETLDRDFKTIKSELQTLVKAGNDVQLHIHPQWYYSTFDGNKWILDQRHYKLTDVPMKERGTLFKDSKELLDDIVGYKTHSFRAGGFSAQPFQDIKPLYEANGISVDSSACPGTRYDTDYQRYDYTGCPARALYQFEDDITIASEKGHFTEVPITMFPVPPLFYWYLAWTRILKCKKHLQFGDGVSVMTAAYSIRERLTRKALSLSTIDGLKILYLYDSMKNAERRGDELFCVIGHPKLATNYSIKVLGRFCQRAIQEGHEFITISQI